MNLKVVSIVRINTVSKGHNSQPSVMEICFSGTGNICLKGESFWIAPDRSFVMAALAMDSTNSTQFQVTSTRGSTEVLPAIIGGTRTTVERLGPSPQRDLLQEGIEHPPIQPPSWLRQLDLQPARKDLRCLRLRTRVVKRIVDCLVASVLLFPAIPIMLLAAIAIKVTSSGPVLFTQIRVGLNTRRTSNNKSDDQGQTNCRRKRPNFGRPFTIYKLRTMHVQADIHGPSQAHKGDNRLIPVGRFLRRMRIDELPQLFNVLSGEMSMVGPRPECIEYMEELSAKVPNYLHRLGLKPGLTGIAQIEAGYANDLESYRRKVAFDLMYLQNCCLGNDLKILARTVKVVMTGFGAI